MEDYEYDYDFLFKVVLIGNSGVGKSALMTRYVEDNFTDSYKATIGVDFKTRTFILQGKTVRLQIWDTAGQERYKSIVSAYYRGALGVFVMYSITDEASFQAAPKWLEEAETHAGGEVKKILLGTKSDLEVVRAVTKERGEEMAAKLKTPFFEVSAKNGTNVEEAFHAMANGIFEERVKGLLTDGKWKGGSEKKKNKNDLDSEIVASKKPCQC